MITYRGDSYILRVVQPSAKMCFENIQPYLMEEQRRDSEQIDAFCFKYLTHIVACNDLFLDLFFFKTMTFYISIAAFFSRNS